MTEEKLTPEGKKVLKEEAEKNGLSEKEIKDVENLVAVTGGMSEAAKRTIIGVVSALGGAALGAVASYGGQRLIKRNEKPEGSTTAQPKNGGGTTDIKKAIVNGDLPA